MVTITYAPLGPQYGAMQSLHYVRDDAVWLNMIESSDLMRNISWLASCISKIKKPNKHCSGNQSVIAGVGILTQVPIFILE
jgi:hypothetical protein